MNKARILIVLLVAVVVGGLLSYGVYQILQRQPQVVSSSPPKKQMAVAQNSLTMGSLVKNEDIGFVPWPGTDQPPVGYFEKKTGLVGRAVLQPMVRNEPFLEGKLAPKEAGAGLPPIIPKGLRALSIRANEIIGVAGYVLPGTRVDVVLTATPRGALEPVTKIVLQNVEVVSAAQVIQEDPEGKPKTVTHVTVLVKPDDAEKLTIASSLGQFQLALRNPLDLDKAETKGIQMTQLYPNYRANSRRRKVVVPAEPATAPAVAPERLKSIVEIIQGNKRSTVEF